MTLMQVLQIQEQLWAGLSNPSAAMQELAGEALPVPMWSSAPRTALKGREWEYWDRGMIPSFGFGLGGGGNCRG